MRILRLGGLFASLVFPAAALAQTNATWATAERPAPPRLDGWSTELMDPYGLTRFNVTTRALFKNGSAWSLEGRMQLRLAEGLAVSATLPVATVSGGGGGGIGNASAGLSYCARLGSAGPVRYHFGGGFDIYAPTASSSDGGVRSQAVAAFRAYEPMLYVPKLASARVRTYFDVQTDSVYFAFEAGLVPAVYVESSGEFLLLASLAGRVSFPLGQFEPYLETGFTPQISGYGHISPPLMVTPGVRMHVADGFNPAVFASFNFVEASAVVVGLDIAAAFRPEEKRRRDDSFEDDFLDTPDAGR